MTPSELYHFINTAIRKFREAGLDPHPLEIVQDTAYTTGSEWLGELGRAIRKIEKQDLSLGELEKDLETILCEVHRVWPNI